MQKKIVLTCVTSICLWATSVAQIPAGVTLPAMPPGVGGATAPKPGPKPYKEVITDKAKTLKGLFTVHKIDEKYYFEISPKLFGKDILVVNRVSKSSIESPKSFGGYAGDQIGENVIRFEKGPNNKVFLKNLSFTVLPDSSKPMFKNVQNSNMQPIAMAFDVKGCGGDEGLPAPEGEVVGSPACAGGGAAGSFSSRIGRLGALRTDRRLNQGH